MDATPTTPGSCGPSGSASSAFTPRAAALTVGVRAEVGLTHTKGSCPRYPRPVDGYRAIYGPGRPRRHRRGTLRRRLARNPSSVRDSRLTWALSSGRVAFWLLRAERNGGEEKVTRAESTWPASKRRVRCADGDGVAVPASGMGLSWPGCTTRRTG